MTNNEFEIDPKKIRRHRPLPPGQTRHQYADKAEKPLLDDDDNADEYDDTEAEAEPQPRRRRTATPKTERTPRRSGTRRVEKEPPAIVRFFFDRRLALFVGLASILVAGGIFIVLLSFIKNGALDQTLILNMTPEQITAAGLEVKSGVGPVGAWFGNLLFAKSFGVGAFVFSAYFAILGWNLMFGRRFNFWSLTFKCLLLAVSLSIIIGLVTYAMSSVTCWGGTHGHYVNTWLLNMTGVPGAMFVSLMLVAALVSVYYNDLARYINRYRESVARRRQERAERIRIAELRRAEAAAADSPDEPEQPDLSEPSDLSDASDNSEAPANDNNEVVFEIDTPADTDMPDNVDDATTDTTTHPISTTPDEPGFEIDVPVVDTGSNTGTVAEQLVAAQGEFDPRAELPHFKFPSLDLLEDRPLRATSDSEEQQANKDRIIKTLGDYKITVSSIKATVGPTVTLYEIVPTEGTRIAQIRRLEDDIAMSLSAKGIRIIAPMPGKGTVGIEVPNREPQIVSMRTILSSRKFRESKAKLPVALGATISNEIFVTDLADMPHALVAGATGQGKSVGLNVIIASLLYRKHPSELKFVLVDPKMVEFSVYERLRGHYLASLPGEEDAIVTDPAKVLDVLNSLCTEMDQRYALLRAAAVNKIDDYNRKFIQRRLSPDKGHKYLPYIVVVIDEFADLIMTGGKEIEMPVMRITQKARAVGIHMIIATQRPSTNVLTGLIKANCPTRIAFRVLQNVDSRTILDSPGAERLIGRGDMLFSKGGDHERMQCAFVTSDEIEAICNSIDAQPGFERPYPLPEPETASENAAAAAIGGGLDRDPLFDTAARFVVLQPSASTSSLQRRFEIGYNRAGKIMDQMEAAGIVGPASGSKPRAVLMDPATLERVLSNR